MTKNNGHSNIPIGQDEKITSVMIYTENLLAWGDVVTKEAIRVSTWLRTQAIPQYIYLHNAKIINFSVANPRTQAYRGLHFPSREVIAFHIKPPDRDPLDIDPNEPERKMEPVRALVGQFYFDGKLRMSNQTNLERFLDVSSESYTSMYELEITQPHFPSMGAIRAPMALIRGELVLFSPNDC
jgi:hypothetical protein